MSKSFGRSHSDGLAAERGPQTDLTSRQVAIVGEEEQERCCEGEKGETNGAFLHFFPPFFVGNQAKRGGNKREIDANVRFCISI